MNLYFAGYSTDKEIFKTNATHLLESYLLFRQKDYVRWHSERKILDKILFLDSGAFSAFTQGKVINLDEYIDYIKKNEKYISVYAGLDVISDWKGTRKNIEYMEACGLNPLPTFHFGSPIDELERLIDKYDYIALGGLVPYSKDIIKLKKWLDICFNVIIKKNKKRKNNIKVHGFGVSAFWAWQRYPFYSVDATSWLMGGKFRRLIKFEGGKFKAYSKRSSERTIELMDCHDLHYVEINRNNIKEYLKGAEYVTRLWENRGIFY